GVAFSPAKRLAIAVALAEMGVPELEIGTPAMGDDERDAMRRIAARRLPCRLTAWCRASCADIDQAADCGVDAVHLSLPCSPIHLQCLGKRRSWVIRRLRETVRYARGRFAYVSIGAQDASRSDLTFLIRVARVAQAAGADRFRLADTVGIWSPDQTRAAVTAICAAAAHMAIAFHGHNDLGMATANTLAAVAAGAECVDVTVNGLGERAGNAPLAEVVMALRLCMQQDAAVDTRRLHEVSRMVALASGRPVAPDKPIVGHRVFCHESGIHVAALAADPRTYEPFSPEDVGHGRRTFVLGKHSGSTAVCEVLSRHGIALERQDGRRMLSHVRALARERKGEVTAKELMPLFVAMGAPVAGCSQQIESLAGPTACSTARS
ncbi:MAG: homocitrate synthase, partial [Patescibacteria group bacterium]|nr:homocitrate synthase [Patescibacteria group bacterium]